MLLLIFSMIGSTNAAPTSKFAYDAHESFLRAAAIGTVWQPGLVESSPHLLAPEQVAGEIFEAFAAAEVPLVNASAMVKALNIPSFRILQCYRVDLLMRRPSQQYFGPEWAAQREPGQASAAMQLQRGGPLSKFALPSLVPSNLSKEEHMDSSKKVDFPFSRPAALDDDADFAARAMAIMGPFLDAWRRRQCRALVTLAKRLEPWEQQARAYMAPSVKTVAAAKAPVFISMQTALLQWPDRTVGIRFITGHKIVGEIEESFIFRKLPEEQVRPDTSADLLASSNESFQAMLKRVRPGDFDQQLLEITLDETAQGTATGPFSLQQMQEVFPGNSFVPMERFIHRQGCGKLRPIDSGKLPGHNQASSEKETIFTHSVDFIPSAVSAVAWHAVGFAWCQRGGDPLELAALPEQELIDLLPEWAHFRIGTDDMKNAYRQIPVHPDHYKFSVSAFWNCKASEVQFIVMYGCPFGLSASVLCFCRTPTLQAAVARRCFGALCCNFFDDMGTIDLLAARNSAQRCIGVLFRTGGLQLDAVKQQPMGDQRVFLGQAVDVGRLRPTGAIQFALKPGFREEFALDIDAILDNRVCGSGSAAKMRGKAGWSSTALHGRCGRGCQAALIKRQYYDCTEILDDQLEKELIGMKILHEFVQPRQVHILAPCRRCSRLYTDASFQPEAGKPPGTGMVLFPSSGAQPIGLACHIDEATLRILVPRSQQITPLEAILGCIAPLNLAQDLAGEDVIWFIDNQAACSCLVKGSSTHPDMAFISMCTHLMLSFLQCRVWFEYVESEANVSDGLSRDGISDTWSKQQGWRLAEAQLPDFAAWMQMPVEQLLRHLHGLVHGKLNEQ